MNRTLSIAHVCIHHVTLTRDELLSQATTRLVGVLLIKLWWYPLAKSLQFLRFSQLNFRVFVRNDMLLRDVEERIATLATPVIE